MPTAPQPAQLTDIIGSLRRHWPVVAIMAIIGLILGVAASFAIPAKYSATTTVSVNPMNSQTLSASVDSARSVSMPTEKGLATSRKAAVAAAEELQPRYSIDADRIVKSTRVEIPEDSLILTIHFTGSSPQQAAAGADAVAKSYLLVRRTDAASEIDRLVKAANAQIAEIQADARKQAYASPIAQRSLRIQADALGTKLAELTNFDLNPGQIMGSAEAPTQRSTPGPVALGLAGVFLGLLAGIPIALLRKEEDSEIGGVDGLHAIGDQIVLDGTKDSNRADTWDIAAFMLKIPTEIGVDGPFMIMVDAEVGSGRSTTPGQELVDALSRRGRAARFVDAGAINEGKISRGWPADKKRITWAGEVIVIDTTHLTSDANKVALATRSDAVLLARSTADDAAALRRLSGLLKSKGVDVALTALFPPRQDMLAANR
ncbi:Wzz/FepE/Etk N-terminal domain-containing protein [Aeromicrobium sp.]|uniref:Wzz/FepE/Etk N-terminal domain-containing protein n=1 Tax=Aeromicrobium sp. TaxID=1871063 RepID=UPI0030C53632